MEIIIYAIIGLVVSYYLIRESVRDAIEKEIKSNIRIQTAILVHQAKQNGMTQEEIDKIVLTPKQFKKKYEEIKIKN